MGEEKRSSSLFKNRFYDKMDKEKIARKKSILFFY